MPCHADAVPGDGVTDDTAAIQRAMTDGGRCGANCGGSTIYPATLYFPSGTYIISSSIIMYYNTEMLGNVRRVPFLSLSLSLTLFFFFPSLLPHPEWVGRFWSNNLD